MKRYEWTILYFELPSYIFCSVTVGGLIKTIKEVNILKADSSVKVISYGLMRRVVYADFDGIKNRWKDLFD